MFCNFLCHHRWLSSCSNSVSDPAIHEPAHQTPSQPWARPSDIQPAMSPPIKHFYKALLSCFLVPSTFWRKSELTGRKANDKVNTQTFFHSIHGVRQFGKFILLNLFLPLFNGQGFIWPRLGSDFLGSWGWPRSSCRLSLLPGIRHSATPDSPGLF